LWHRLLYLTQVNHIDGVKLNNHYTNLEWATSSENIQHSFDTGLNRGTRGQDVVGSVLKDHEVHDICRMMESGLTTKQIMEVYPQNFKTLSNIRTGTRWVHITGQYSIPCKRQPRMPPDDVEKVCQMLSSGLSPREISEMPEFSYVTESSIYNIFKRKFHTKISSAYEW
jgi:uncharacterized protein (DUF433 family)